MFLQNCEDGLCSFNFVSFLMNISLHLKALPLFLDFFKGAFDLILLLGDLAGVCDRLSITQEIFLDIDFIKGK